MAHSKIIVIHRNVEIAYDEFENSWKFELWGRERKAESLAKAKEFINKPEPVSQKKFAPIAGFMSGDNEKFEDVSVTSIAERRYGSGTYVWVSKNGSRFKERQSGVYQDSPENRQIQAEILELVSQIRNLEKLKEGKVASLKLIDISAWEASK